MRWLKTSIAVFLAVQASSALAQDAACPAPLKPMLRVEMFFGRNIVGKLRVSERQWTQFVQTELAARFPGGLTVLDGRGRWRDPAHGTTVSEPSKVVIAVAPDNASMREAIAAAAEAYKQRFKQKSVGIVTGTVCAAF
ncbi:MAG TPA: DUF3574 domain-containing protein [Pseudolabrys sp.]|nr:DUF3574 domain-containing protein [Pseudolabrys sp.]